MGCLHIASAADPSGADGARIHARPSLKESGRRVDAPAVTALRSRRPRPALRVAASLAAVGLAAGLASWAAPLRAQAQSGDDRSDVSEAVQQDDDVRAARERLDAARDEATALAQRLDQAAARFEQARAHRLRLEGEAERLAADAAAATEAASAAEAAFEQVVVASYKRPGVALEAGAAVLESAGGDALHRAALVQRVVAGEEDQAQRLAAEARRAEQARQQHRTIRAGVAGAQRAAREAASALEEATAAAGERAAELAGQLESAERDARQRLEAERRRQRLAERATQAGGRGRTVLPSGAALPGMACPVGQPNGFIDSWHYPRSGGRVHQGVDVFADRGTPVYAVADGTVRRVWHNDLGGLSIDLVDDRGDRYYYAHLQAAHVASGQRVAAGEHIGAVGNSGNARSTPPHVHWQYHPGDGDAVNPFPLASTLCR